jgi:hypothetical protein
MAQLVSVREVVGEVPGWSLLGRVPVEMVVAVEEVGVERLMLEPTKPMLMGLLGRGRLEPMTDMSGQPQRA